MSGDWPLWQVDAFTDRPYAGNPAAVCHPDGWPPAETMQAIAAENNLAETAFVVAEPEGLRIRWLTPATEVDLCGHATLAAAFVHFEFVAPDAVSVTFDSRSGPLSVTREGGLLVLDFPARPAAPVTPPPGLFEALGIEPEAVLAADDFLVAVEDERAVRALVPDLRLLAGIEERRGFIVTAPGDDCDFVSRFFAPRFGIDEDPVTGSAHCTLAPYWADRLGRSRLHARQLSARGGELVCEPRGDRVRIGGHAALYLTGKIVR